MNATTLREITDDSGGRTEVVHNAAELIDATARIADELNHQYVLGYTSPRGADGKYHSIRVRVRGSGYKVRARNGYVAEPRTAGASSDGARGARVNVSGLAPAVQLRADGGVTGRANTMAELRVGVLGDVPLHLLPVLIVAANALAVAADREEAAQLFDVGERRLQLLDALGQVLLQREDADADLDARAAPRDRTA